MTFSPEFPLTGVSAALKDLGRIDTELGQAARKQIKDAAAPMVAAIRGFIPFDAPMSGMVNRGRLGWSSTRVQSSIKAKVSTRVGSTRYIPLLSVVQNNPAGVMWDMAGRRSKGNTAAGRNMIKVLNEGNGKASRSMWKDYDRLRKLTEENLRLAIVNLEETLDQRLRGNS